MSAARPPLAAWLCLVAGALATAWGGPIVLLAEAADPLAKAAWRCGLATLFLLPFARRHLAPAWRALPPRERALQFVAGGALALHFASWIASFEYTSVASSLVLVCTTPLWTALLSPWMADERPKPRELAGMAVALVGVAGIGADDFRVGGQAWIGDLLALLGALAAAVYLLLSRRIQRRVPTLAFLSVCYGSAAAVLLGACLAGGVALSGFDGRTTLALVGLAVVPQLIGHSSYNLALRWLPTPTVAVAPLTEPVLGSLIAFLLLDEVPPAATVAWGAVILAGVFAAVLPARRSAA
jgi:drug/metabolite transporter (DMT)-like permease